MHQYAFGLKICFLMALIGMSACSPAQITSTPNHILVSLPTETRVPTPTSFPTDTPLAPSATATPACPPRVPDTVMILQNPKDYVGKLYAGNDFSYADHKNLPTEGFIEEGGILIETPVAHVLVVMATKYGHMLWLQKLICMDAEGVSFFQVTDSILLPELKSERRIFFHPDRMCIRPEDGEIVAIGKPGTGKSKFVTDPQHAWEVTWPNGTLIEIPTAGIQCYANAGAEY